MKKILIIEDDKNLGTTVASVLEAKNYEVRYLTSGKKLMYEFKHFAPHLIVMDIVLNEELDGFQLAHQIRTVSQVPILFSTSRDSHEDFEKGFGVPNSDYVRKPYKMVEMLKRIERMLEISADKQGYLLGNFTFTPNERTLRYALENIELSNYESEVLNILCTNCGQYINRSAIIAAVWKVADPKMKEGSLNNILTCLRKYLQKEEMVELESRVGLGVRITVKQ